MADGPPTIGGGPSGFFVTDGRYRPRLLSCYPGVAPIPA